MIFALISNIKIKIFIPLFVFPLIFSCQHLKQTVNLVSISSFESNLIISGEENHIFGEGFVPGEVEIVFDGKWKKGGEFPIHRKVAIKGLVVDDSTISFIVKSSDFWFSCFSHIFFQGKVSVYMKSVVGEGNIYITGTRDRMKLDFLDMEPKQDYICRRNKNRADAFLKAIGLEAEEIQDGGLKVKRIEKGKIAHNAGVKEGDLLLLMDGMKLYSIQDILPVKGGAEASLIVYRSGESDLRKIQLKMSLPPQVVIKTEDVIFIAVFFLLILALQSRRVIELLEKLGNCKFIKIKFIKTPSGQSGSNSSREVKSEEVRKKYLDKAVSLLLAPIVVFPSVTVFAFLALRYGDRIDGFSVCLIIFLTLLLSSIGDSRDKGIFENLVKRIVTSIFITLPVFMICIFRWLQCSDGSLRSLGSDQSFHPLNWNGLKDPFSFILLFITLFCSSIAERRKSSSMRYLLLNIFSILMVSMVVLVMMGGFEIPYFVQSLETEKKIGTLIFFFVLKVLMTYFFVQATFARKESFSPSLVNSFIFAVSSIVAFSGALVVAPVMTKYINNMPLLTSAVAFTILIGTVISFARKQEAG